MSWSYLKTCIISAIDNLHKTDMPVIRVSEDQVTGKVHITLPSTMTDAEAKYVQAHINERWFVDTRIVVSRQP